MSRNSCVHTPVLTSTTTKHDAAFSDGCGRAPVDPSGVSFGAAATTEMPRARACLLRALALVTGKCKLKVRRGDLVR